MESIKELEYLDRILLFIKNSADSEVSLTQICKEITGSPYNSNVSDKELSIEISDTPNMILINGTKYELQNKLIEALVYLHKEELIRFVSNEIGYRLTFKGIVKSYFGFADQYKEKETYKNIQYQNLIATTNLAISQNKDVIWAKWRSWIAIIISILTIVATVTVECMKDNKDAHPPNQTRTNTKKSKLVDIEKLSEFSKNISHDSINKKAIQK